jgi:DNA/RNA endonuclease YhcR with UshA esterase domain
VRHFKTWCVVAILVTGATIAKVRAQDAKTEPAPPSTQAAPVLVTADDAAAIKAALDKDVILDGEVKSAAWSSSGKVMRIAFKNADESKVQAVIFQAKKEKFDASFDGDVTKAIAGAHIRVSGKLKDFKGQPEVVVNEVHQLTIVEGGPSTKPAGQ